MFSHSYSYLLKTNNVCMSSHMLLFHGCLVCLVKVFIHMLVHITETFIIIIYTHDDHEYHTKRIIKNSEQSGKLSQKSILCCNTCDNCFIFSKLKKKVSKTWKMETMLDVWLTRKENRYRVFGKYCPIIRLSNFSGVMIFFSKRGRKG